MSFRKAPESPVLPKTPLDSSTKKRSPSTGKTSSSIDSIATPFTPFSIRSRGLSSAFATPLTDPSPSLPRSLKVSRNSVADTSANWRTKSLDATSSDSPSERPVLRSPAFLSNDRRLPTGLQRSSPLKLDSLPRSSPKMSLKGKSSMLAPAAPLDFPFRRNRYSDDDVLPAISEDDDSKYIIRMDSHQDSHSPCAGCGTHLSTISHLKPCLHPICHQCFTGMLNIVNEKGLTCPICRSLVTDFACPVKSTLDFDQFKTIDSGRNVAVTSSSFDHSSSSPSLLRKSTTALPNLSDSVAELPVIRIDNLPWDVTPDMLSEWLTVPADRIHVLLERSTGKTLSHCYIELSLQNARTVLRTCQNKIIGQGRRTRAVSVTISTQEELMKELFPAWGGSFKSTHPSVAGLEPRQVTEAAHCSFLSYAELDSLLKLMQTPESHFLKVPTLPFYALASILQKFPVDGDAQLFWMNNLRDRLFTLTQVAVQILAIRVTQQQWDSKLLDELAFAAIGCLAFTDVQRRLIQVTANLPESYPPSTASECSEAPTPAEEYIDDLQPQAQPSKPTLLRSSPRDVSRSTSIFEEIGEDVGADAEVVRLVFQRLLVSQ